LKNSDTTRWQICRDFKSVSWPDGVVVYDPLSGDTHQLELASAEILMLIQETPCTLHTLETRLLSSDLFASDAADQSAIEAILTDLSALGFIHPEPH